MATDTNTPNVEGGSTPSENSQASGLPNYNPNHIASVVDGEGSTTKYSYNPLDKDFGGDGSSHSVICEAVL